MSIQDKSKESTNNNQVTNNTQTVNNVKPPLPVIKLTETRSSIFELSSDKKK